MKTTLVFLTLFASTFAFAGEFVPKSYYTIDHNGRQSDVIYFRSKRDVELFPLLRMKRGNSNGHEGANSYSHSYSTANGGGGGGGGGNIPFNLQDIPFVGNIDPGFNFASRGNFPGAGGGSFAPAGGNGGYDGPILFSRSGEDHGTGVHVSGSAQGERGAFSSSSSSVDGNGKIKYSVQSGKY